MSITIYLFMYTFIYAFGIFSLPYIMWLCGLKVGVQP